MKIISFFIAAVLVFSSSLIAGGTETNPLAGAKTLALNGLYIAGSDGIAKTLNNPAGIIFINQNEIEFSILDRLGQNEHVNDARGLHRSFRNDDIIFNGGVLWNFSENFKSAVSYQQAVNYNVEWPFANYFENDSANALLLFDMYNKISADAISLSAAYSFGNITIGISPSAYHIKHKTAFPQSNPLWQNGVGQAAYQVEYDQEGWGFGFSFGILAEASSGLIIGASLRSTYSADLSGTAKSRMFAQLDSISEQTDLTSRIEFPWVIGIGAVYSINQKIKMNIDFQYSLWGSTQKNITENFSNSLWQNRLSTIDSFSGIQGNNFMLSYNNSLDAGIGFEFLSDSGLRYWLGYRYSQSPNSDETYNMLFPAVDQHWLSVGAGLNDDFISLEGMIAYAFGTEKNIIKNLPSLSGTYNSNIVVPMATIKYWFY